MKYIIPAAVAIGVGLLILASYLVPDPALLSIRLALMDWAVVLGGLAILVGALNLFLVHGRRIQSGDRGWVYSLVTILAALLTLAVGVFDGLGTETSTLYQTTSLTNALFRGVLVASYSALASLLVFFLVVSAVRLMKTKPNSWSIIFLAAVVVVLVGWIPFTFMRPVSLFRQWLLNVPVSAGARGILLGVALGTIVIGVRVLTGVERPYKD